MGRICFVTGTDTEIGKTVISSALVLTLRDMGLQARGLKPIESGCHRSAAGLIGEDSRSLALVSDAAIEDTTLYRYELPLAPSAAARLGGQSEVDLLSVVAWIRQLARSNAYTVVEGLGGLMVPLNREDSVLDLIKELTPDAVLLVASNRLGVLSQVLTAARVLEQEKLPLAGVVLNSHKGQEGLAERSNREELEHWIRPVVPFPWLDTVDPTSLTEPGERLVRAFQLV